MPRREPSVSADPITLRPDVTGELDGAGIAARWVGQRVLRSEDQRMITGHGQYVDDQQKPGMVHATFVRSTVARGRIVHLDVSEARRAAGVIAVFTAAELNSRARIPAGRGADQTPRRVLADGDVRYVGEPVVMVIAESRYLAEDAAELVSLEIEPDTPVVTMAQALAEGGPRVHPERPDNLAGVVPAADSPQLDAIIEHAPHVFTETFDQHRYVDVPMETRGLVAEWDQQVGHLEVMIAGQGVHVPRAFFARMLDLTEDK